MSSTDPREFLVTKCVRVARDDAQSFREGPARFASCFFQRWFREQGRAFFFLFHKNLSVTNLAHAELLSLLRKHTAEPPDGETDGNVQRGRRVEPMFASLDDFKLQLQDLYRAFDHQDATDCVRGVSSLLAATIMNMIVVRPFFGSCNVYLPAGLYINLATVCGLSGYIHSCGRLVYVRNVEKAADAEFREAVYQYADTYEWPKPPTPGAGVMIVYCHEDFTSHDRAKRSRLAGGLDDVKIHLEKFHIGSKNYPTRARRLVDALADPTFLKQRVDIAPAGHFKKSKVEEDQEIEHEPTRSPCLWLITDRAIDGAALLPGSSRYFIIYHQEYVNGNPCHIFDENKPAWVAHTTIPHTLIGAVLNIAALHAPDDACIADPFSGTGTTGFEVAKYPRMSCDCSDHEQLSKTLFEHNRLFLSAGAEELSAVGAILSEAAGRATSVTNDDPAADAKALCTLEDDNAAAVEAGRLLSACDVSTAVGQASALFVYVGLRARLRHAVAIKRANETIDQAFVSELKELVAQMEELRRMRRRCARHGSTAEGLESLCVYPAKYSDGISPMASTYGSSRIRHEVRDVRKLPERTYDVIMADPPYGFNTDDRPEDLSVLYLEMIPALVKALKRPSSQLLLCLPARSYVGRLVWAFVLPDFVSTLVARAAAEQGLQLLSRQASTPSPARVFMAPYYWDSERALRRRILHFEFSQTRVSPFCNVIVGGRAPESPA